MNLPVVIIGVGNELRGDDGAGRVTARLLARQSLPGKVTVHESDGEALTLMELWQGAAAVILIDAASGEGATPGKVIRLDAGTTPLPSGFLHRSSHALSVADAVEMARALGRLPTHSLVFAIGGCDFAHGKKLSPAARRGCKEATTRILAELSRDCPETLPLTP